MDFENLDLSSTVSRDRVYVSWTEQWDMDRYVDHYLLERKLALSQEARSAIRNRIEGYPWEGPRKKAELDSYLDGTVVL